MCTILMEVISEVTNVHDPIEEFGYEGHCGLYT